jgi:putative membrane protein
MLVPWIRAVAAAGGQAGRPDVIRSGAMTDQDAAADIPEVEPDYRFTLANERTYLAWIRTALALIAGGIALKAVAGAFNVQWLATTVGVAATVLGGVLPLTALRHWRAVQKAMRRGEPLPVQRAAIVLTTGIVVLSGVLALAVLL